MGLVAPQAAGIFPTQGSNLRLLHWQADSLPLSHQRSSLIISFKRTATLELVEAQIWRGGSAKWSSLLPQAPKDGEGGGPLRKGPSHPFTVYGVQGEKATTRPAPKGHQAAGLMLNTPSLSTSRSFIWFLGECVWGSLFSLFYSFFLFFKHDVFSYFLSRGIKGQRWLPWRSYKGLHSNLIASTEKKKAQPQSWELCFIWWKKKMRTEAWDTASQIALRDCSEDVRGEPGYIRVFAPKTRYSEHPDITVT